MSSRNSRTLYNDHATNSSCIVDDDKWGNYPAGKTWVDRSFAYDPVILNFTPTRKAYVLLLIAVSVLVLVHSRIIHWNARRYTSIRLQTEIGAVAGLLVAVFELISIFYVGPTVWAVVYEFFSNGVLTMVVQVCDNYMFLDRLCVVHKVSRRARMLYHIYIWVVLVLTWIPVNTIVQFFYDMNSDGAQFVYFYTLSVSNFGNVLYNCFITFQVGSVLFKLTPLRSFRLVGRSKRLPSSSGLTNHAGVAGGGDHFTPQAVAAEPAAVAPQKSGSAGVAGGDVVCDPLSSAEFLARLQFIRIVAMKSFGHCLTSSLAHLYWQYMGVHIADPFFVITLILGLHVWVNMKVEGYFGIQPVIDPIVSGSSVRDGGRGNASDDHPQWWYRWRFLSWEELNDHPILGCPFRSFSLLSFCCLIVYDMFFADDFEDSYDEKEEASRKKSRSGAGPGPGGGSRRGAQSSAKQSRGGGANLRQNARSSSVSSVGGVLSRTGVGGGGGRGGVGGGRRVSAGPSINRMGADDGVLSSSGKTGRERKRGSIVSSQVMDPRGSVVMPGRGGGGGATLQQSPQHQQQQRGGGVIRRQSGIGRHSPLFDVNIRGATAGQSSRSSPIVGMSNKVTPTTPSVGAGAGRAAPRVLDTLHPSNPSSAFALRKMNSAKGGRAFGGGGGSMATVAPDPSNKKHIKAPNRSSFILLSESSGYNQKEPSELRRGSQQQSGVEFTISHLNSDSKTIARTGTTQAATATRNKSYDDDDEDDDEDHDDVLDGFSLASCSKSVLMSSDAAARPVSRRSSSKKGVGEDSVGSSASRLSSTGMGNKRQSLGSHGVYGLPLPLTPSTVAAAAAVAPAQTMTEKASAAAAAAAPPRIMRGISVHTLLLNRGSVGGTSNAAVIASEAGRVGSGGSKH